MPNSYAAIPASQPLRRPAPPHVPADDSSASPPAPQVASPREADVEMIQGLIRKLAAEVDVAEMEKLDSVVSAADKARAIEESVGALKRTAETMKAPAAAGGFVDGSEQDEVDTQPLGFRRSRERAAPPPPPHADETPRSHDTRPTAEPEFDVDTLMRRAETIAAPAPAAGAAPAGAPPALAAEPEFDVDKLMRRAQPIASMSSEPVSLPVQPDAAMDHAAFDADTRDERASVPRDADEPEADAGPEVFAEAAIDPRLARVAEAIEAGRVEVFLEPILDLARQQPSHYEVTVCLRDADGTEIGAGDDMADGRTSSALPLLDSVRLSRTAQVARLLEERRKPGSVFSTFSGQSLASDEFLGTFADTFEANETLAHQLVLTFAQSDVRGFRGPQWSMLQEMRDLGFRFALRAVTDLDMDFEPLARAGFAFAKLDAEVFLEGMTAPGAIISSADICNYLADQGLAVVVEHIDDESRRSRVFASGVQLGQGQLFGGPRLMKASALAAPRPVAA